MRSWPRSRQEAVYRPAVGDELSDRGEKRHFGFMHTHTHMRLGDRYVTVTDSYLRYLLIIWFKIHFIFIHTTQVGSRM